MSDLLGEKAEQRALVTITRDFENAENVHGFLLDVSKELVLIHILEDFHLDGYGILPRSTVAAVEHSQANRYLAAILRSEKVVKEVGISPSIDLSSWSCALKSVKSRGANVIIEHDEKPFVIGEILRVNKQSVTTRRFDALGKWDPESERLSYDGITLVSFENEYVTTFSRYLRDR